MANDENEISKYKLVINSHPLFSSLKEEGLHTLVSLCKFNQFKKGEIVVSEGDIIDSFYFIIQGEAKVSTTIKDISLNLPDEERQLLLTILTKGDAIGLNDQGLFSSTGLRTATVTAFSDLQLIKIQLKDFLIFLKENTSFQKSFTEAIEKIARIDFIQKACPFLEISASKICELAEKIKDCTVAAKTTIFHKGDSADNCYLIRSGKVEILIQHKEEKKSIVLEEGSLFGETAILTGEGRNATAKTLTSCQLLVLPRELFVEIVKSDEPTAQSIFFLMINRLCPVQAEGIIIHKRTSKDNNSQMLLHNPKEAQVYRLTKEGWLIWQLINGHNTVQDITMLLFKEIRVFAPEMVCSFLYQLSELGFVSIPFLAPEFIAKEKEPNKISKWFQFEIMISNMDKKLTWLYQKVKWPLFKWPIQLLMLAISILGLFSFFQFKFELKNVSLVPHWIPLLVLFLFLAGIVTVVLHELAHALTTKHFGYQVKRVGLGWFFLGPVAFVDTCELWLATPKQRILVDLAGVYNDCFFAGLAAIFSMMIANQTIAIFFWIYSLIIYLNCIRNLSPIKEYDGYFALADYLDKPHLRENAIRDFQKGFIFNNKENMIYWSACLFYLFVYFIFIFITLKYLLTLFAVTSVLGIPAVYFSAFIASLMVIFPMVIHVSSQSK